MTATPEQEKKQNGFSFPALLPIFVTVFLATTPAILGYLVKSSIMEYKVEQLQKHSDGQDTKMDSIAAKQDAQALTINTLVNGQAESKTRGESILELVKEQKASQEQVRQDLQQIRMRFK